MTILRYIPTLILPIGIYAIIAFPAGAHTDEHLNSQLFAITMASGDVWRMTLGAALLCLAIVCQMIEVIRSASPRKAALGENMIGVVLWIISLILFLLVRGFGTAEFFLLLLLLLSDYLTDAVIMVFTSRRTIDINR